MATIAEIETPHPSDTTSEPSADTAAASSAAHEPNWWWDYAAMKAPDENMEYYFKFSVLAVAFFFTAHLIVHLLCLRTRVYPNCDNKKQAYFRTTVVSIFHSCICIVLCTIGLLMICPGDQTVFNSDVCINTVRYIHIWAVITSCGFFMVDLFVIVFQI